MLRHWQTNPATTTHLESEMSIKLEAGKHYKTRDGKKIDDLELRGEYFYSKTSGHLYWGNGRALLYEGKPHDIISEWHEPESYGVDATLSQRQKTHGEFSDHARIAQELKGCLIPVRGELQDTHREALDMICHKIARILAGDTNEPDHWHDIAGYATLVEKEIKNGMPTAACEC